MEKDQKDNTDLKKNSEAVIPASPVDKPADPDEVVHELPDVEPEVPADPDDLIHTFPPQPEITNADDVDDLIHPPAIDGEEPE